MVEGWQQDSDEVQESGSNSGGFTAGQLHKAVLQLMLLLLQVLVPGTVGTPIPSKAIVAKARRRKSLCARSDDDDAVQESKRMKSRVHLPTLKHPRRPHANLHPSAIALPLLIQPVPQSHRRLQDRHNHLHHAAPLPI